MFAGTVSGRVAEGAIRRGHQERQSRSKFAQELLSQPNGIDLDGPKTRKRAIRTRCADRYLSDKDLLLGMIRTRIKRLGLGSVDIHRSLDTYRKEEHWRLTCGFYDVNISLKRAYQVAEAVGLRKVRDGFGFVDPDVAPTTPTRQPSRWAMAKIAKGAASPWLRSARPR